MSLDEIINLKTKQKKSSRVVRAPTTTHTMTQSGKRRFILGISFLINGAIGSEALLNKHSFKDVDLNTLG
ncbi:hypothetical protein GQX74_014898 [Glossina fuscipes]|nr:hypothetical protein GQX74_014898 [Glossina fuscipes]